MASKNDTTATIAASSTTSGAINNHNADQSAIQLPATFTGTTLTFTVCFERDGTYVALANDSGNISITVAQNKAYLLPAALMLFPYFKVVSGSTEAAARTLRIFRFIT